MGRATHKGNEAKSKMKHPSVIVEIIVNIIGNANTLLIEYKYDYLIFKYLNKLLTETFLSITYQLQRSLTSREEHTKR